MKILILAALVLGLLVSACRKAEEAAGPENPAGEAADRPAAGGGGGSTVKSGPEAPKLPGKSGERPPRKQPSYKYAAAMEGKPGFGVNPFTGNTVDLRGIPEDTLVRDPQDPDPEHKFRVSREVAEAYAEAQKQK